MVMTKEDIASIKKDGMWNMVLGSLISADNTELPEKKLEIVNDLLKVCDEEKDINFLNKAKDIINRDIKEKYGIKD